MSKPTSQGTRDKGQGTRDKGQGTRDKGQGTSRPPCRLRTNRTPFDAFTASLSS